MCLINTLLSQKNLSTSENKHSSIPPMLICALIPASHFLKTILGELGNIPFRSHHFILHAQILQEILPDRGITFD